MTATSGLHAMRPGFAEGSGSRARHRARQSRAGPALLQLCLPAHEQRKASPSRSCSHLSSALTSVPGAWNLLERGSGLERGLHALQGRALGAAAWRAPGGRRRRNEGVVAKSKTRGRMWKGTMVLAVGSLSVAPGAQRRRRLHGVHLCSRQTQSTCHCQHGSAWDS